MCHTHIVYPVLNDTFLLSQQFFSNPNKAVPSSDWLLLISRKHHSVQNMVSSAGTHQSS